MHTPKVLVVATSRKTRGGITSVVKAHETGNQWKKYHCKWIETHRDGPSWRKILYFIKAKLLQKSEMRKDIVIELSYKGFG